MQTASTAGSRQRQGLSHCPRGPQLITSCGTADHWHFVSFLAAQLDPYAANMAPGSQVKHTSRHILTLSEHNTALPAFAMSSQYALSNRVINRQREVTRRDSRSRFVNSGGVIEVDLWPLLWLTSTSEFARKRSGHVNGPDEEENSNRDKVRK